MNSMIIIIGIVAILCFATWKIKQNQKKEAKPLDTFDILEDIVVFEEFPLAEPEVNKVIENSPTQKAKQIKKTSNKPKKVSNKKTTKK